jgi:hypothetical protein
LPISELESIWNSAVGFVSRIRNEREEVIDRSEREVVDEEDDDDSEQDTLQLIEQNCSEFFLDQYGSPYAAVTINQHREIMSLQSKRFRNWICKTYYETIGELLNAEKLASTLNILKANAEFSGRVRELHLRVALGGNASDSNLIYYDLTNNDW